MISHVSYIMTLANSIIGVSVLAMPFCFKQCGVILAIIVLLLCSLLSRLACHFLIKSAVMSRRRNFEFLAFHAFGQMGKFLVELFIIGFLLGTCIAFYVVIGDLGPQIIGKMLNKNPDDIRISFLLTTGALIVLPLGLLRNIDSLATICTATIGFYLCLVLKVMTESIDHIFRGDWYNSVNYWRPAGILQCLPIFSMALFCQTQLFEIYESIPNVTLEKMNFVVKGALNICTIVYLCVGFFGYVAFCDEPFSGNILLAFEPSLTADVIKIGFVLSVVFSFPLVIFPCRASLNSLLFRQVHTHEQASNYIPEIRFRCLTFTIVTASLITGIMMPNIEFVLGLVGSTIGVMICLISPAGFFIVISTKNTNERLLAQVMLFIGMWIMILGTYANLYAMEESSTTKITINTEKPIIHMNNMQLDIMNEHNEMLLPELPLVLNQPKKNDLLESNINRDQPKNSELKDIRREPPIPIERPAVTEKASQDSQQMLNSEKPSVLKNKEFEVLKKSVNSLKKDAILLQKDTNVIEEKHEQDQQANEILINSEVKKNEDAGINNNSNNNDNKVNSESNGKIEPEQFFKKLEQHREETRKLLEEQREILKDIKQQKEELKIEKKKRLMEKINPIDINTGSQSKVELLETKNNVADDKIHENIQDPKKIDAIESNHEKFIEEPSELKAKLNGDKSDKNNLNANDTKVNVPLNSGNQNEISKNINLTPLNISSIDSRGPILNALTNWTTVKNLSGSQEIENQNKLNDFNKIEIIDKSVQYELPIPLKHMNQTAENIQNNGINKSAAESPLMEKTNLEENHREKRETKSGNLSESSFNDSNMSILIHKTIDGDKSNGIGHSTDGEIKNYADLEQLKNNDRELLKSSSIGIEYQVIKKRDLKALKVLKFNV